MASPQLAIELQLKDLASKDLKRFGRVAGASTKKAGQGFKKLDQSIGKTTKRLVGLVGGFLAFRSVMTGIRRSVGAGFGFVDASAEFEESVSKFGVVFGDFAQGTARDLDTLADAVGRPRTELLDFAATFQDTLVPMGIMREEAAGLSVDLVALAVDAASFGNKLDADAVRDFQSALVGNHETVRKYGIVITEASLKNEAWTTGLTALGAELTNQEKIQARLQLITKGLSDAIGDAERTSGSYQNTMKRLTGEIGELRVVFGDLLQKEILDAIEELGGLDKVTDQVKVGFGLLTGVTRKFISAAKDAAITFKELLEAFGGANDIAAGLVGNMLSFAFVMDTLSISVKAFGTIFVRVLDGLLTVTGIWVSDMVSAFKDQLLIGMLDGIQGAIVASIRALEDSPIAEALFPMDAANALFDSLGGLIDELHTDAEERALKSGDSISQTWGKTWGDVALTTVDALEQIKAKIREAGEEGIDFDFNLEGLFGGAGLSEVEQAAKNTGNKIAKIFGTEFGLIAKIVINEGLTEALKQDAPTAEDVPVGFFEAFGDEWTKIGESLTDQNLGAELAGQTFGALENGLNDFSDALVEGEADFGEFAKNLIKDLAKILIKMALLRGFRALGFAEGGVASADGAEEFATGGIMTGQGRLPVRNYARGGIANTPQLAVFGEGSNAAEAFVPLGGDRKIPVKMEGGGGGGGGTVNISIVSIDPKGAADVIQSNMGIIQKGIAKAMQSGSDRSLVTAIRSTARGGR